MSNFKTKFGKTFLRFIEIIIMVFIFLFIKKTNPKISQKKITYRFSLITLSIFILIITKLNHLKINLVNIIFEITFFYILYLLTFPKREERIVIYAIKNYIFNIIFYISLLVFTLNSIYITDTILMKFTVFNFNPSVIPFVFNNMVKINYIFYFIIAIILLNLFSIKISKLFNKEIKYFTFKNVVILTSIFMLISGITYTIDANNITNIYVNSLEESYNLFMKQKIKIEDNKDIIQLNTSLKLENLSKNKKILVFVMEQTSRDDFYRELEYPTFFNLVKNNTHSYNNYYTQNQDSRTSLWAMLYKVFQPFESYIDNWNEYYGYIMEEKSLIDIFNKNDYKTLGISSVSQVGLIMGAMNWTDYINLKDYKNKSKDFICFNDFEYQKGCEDRAILDEIKQFIKENKNQSYFLFQEMIFGHGENYMLNAKTTRSQYYNNYFYDLYKYMIENDLIDDDTYIIIVSDHGPKGGIKDRTIKDFNVPFFIINSNFSYEQNNDLLTHVDFISILENEIYYRNSTINRSEAFFIGQTSKNIIGYKSYNKEFIGNLFNNNFIINEQDNISNEEIEDKLNELRILQNSFINKSREKYFYCEQCIENINKFE